MNALLQILGGVLVPAIAVGTSYLVAQANRKAQVQDAAAVLAKQYIDDALVHAKDEVTELRQWKKDGESRMAELNAEVRGLRAEVKALQEQVANRDSEIARLSADHHAARDADRLSDET